jgi:putative heme-binding domain-containing protein
VHAEGLALRAERPADEQRTEFLTSSDTWFRPVQMANAPDGTLYVIDMYREIIEHPWSLPPSLKKHLDLNSGNDRGRIYRVVPDGFQQPKRPLPGKATTAELVQMLEHRNGWHRDTAARLLYERQDPTAGPLLEKLARESKSGLGRMHALYALDGLGALKVDALLQAYGDADDRVVEHAVRLAEKFVSRPSPVTETLAQGLRSLAGHPSIYVNYQLAFTLGELPEPEPQALLATLQLYAADPWMRAAVLSSLKDRAGEVFQVLVNGLHRTNAMPAATATWQPFLCEVVRVIGARNNSNEVASVLDQVAREPDPSLAFALVHGLGEGLQRARATVPTEKIKPVLDRATKLTADKSQPEAVRVEAVELLALSSFAESGELLLSLLELKEPQPVQLAAIHTLGRFTDARIAPELTRRWLSLTPQLRSEALTVLLARPDRATVLLDAVEAKSIRRADLASPQIDFLTNHREAALRARAITLLTAANANSRQQVVNAFQSALTLPGDAARGKKIFTERCVSCHRLGGEGFVLGPDLVSVRNAGKEKLLIGILDPSREVLPQYLAYEIETKDEESLLGVLVNETATAVTLRQPYGKETVVPRANILTLRSRGQSIMPDELESGLSPQAVADLLEHIGTADK